MKLFKATRLDGQSIHGDGAVWSLPSGGLPGAWMPRREIVLTSEQEIVLRWGEDGSIWRSSDPDHWPPPHPRSYALATEFTVPFVVGPAVWEAEARDVREALEYTGEILVPQARLVRRIEAFDDRAAFRFAVDVAERAAWIWEHEAPGDETMRRVIEAARRFVRGEATPEDVRVARGDNPLVAAESSWAAFYASGAVMAVVGASDGASAARQAVFTALAAVAWSEQLNPPWSGDRDAKPETREQRARRAQLRQDELRWIARRLQEYFGGQR